MKKEKFNFLQDHSVHFLEMALSMDKRTMIHNPDGYGKRTGECGDTIEIFLMGTDDTITSVSFNTDGCINTHACANTVAHLAEGKPLENAWEITPEKIAEYLETLPSSQFHCAELAVGALYLALSNFRENAKAPWKKLYHNKTCFNHVSNVSNVSNVSSV
ncbi:MAG: iron-sulfur cluster assembly scaffold protein [Desulfobacterales bacterium]|nr:iron-sulfur cluster assembly scaffold protein [Desulfobacterales bacterium]